MHHLPSSTDPPQNRSLLSATTGPQISAPHHDGRASSHSVNIRDNVLILPLPELGHISPTLNIAQYLIRQGCNVTYLTAPHFREIISYTGATLQSLLLPTACDGDASGTHIWNLFRNVDGPASRNARLRQVLQPLLISGAYSLILLDRQLASVYHPDIFTATRVMLFSTSLPDWNNGAPTASHLPTIIFCPAQFEVPRYRYPFRKLQYVEPSLGLCEDNTVGFQELSNDRPLVLAAFGSQSVKDRRLSDKYRLVIELSRQRSDLQFVLAAPRKEELLKAGSPRSVPENLIIVDRIPQRRLLKGAAVFITHGGLGSIKEAIIEGVPMIVLPTLHDQPFNAMRVRYHGLGNALFHERSNLHNLAAHLSEALTGTFKKSLYRMREYFLAMEYASVSHMLIDGFRLGGENSSTPGS